MSYMHIVLVFSRNPKKNDTFKRLKLMLFMNWLNYFAKLSLRPTLKAYLPIELRPKIDEKTTPTNTGEHFTDATQLTF